jgi:hypothetical protein
LRLDAWGEPAGRQTDKSFLVLFFKKEQTQQRFAVAGLEAAQATKKASG